MLSKTLTQFSVDGWSYVASLLFTWGQSMVEVMKIIGTSLKRSHACTAALSSKWWLHSTGAASGGEEIPPRPRSEKPSKMVGGRADMRRYPISKGKGEALARW